MYVQCSAATPTVLVDAMTKHGIAAKLRDVEVIHLHTEGAAEYAEPHCEGMKNLFTQYVGIRHHW